MSIEIPLTIWVTKLTITKYLVQATNVRDLTHKLHDEIKEKKKKKPGTYIKDDIIGL